MRCKVRWAALAVFALTIGAAQTPTFTGRWKLNPAKSSWGRKVAPVAVTIDIEDRGQALKYSGIVVDTHGEDREFEFSGAADGREYPAVRASGEGKVILERVGPYAILASFKTNDGSVAERTRMSLSRDGKVLTHLVEVTRAGSTTRWVERYERQ